MKRKLMLGLSLVILSIFLINPVSAMTVYAEWDTSNSNTLSINDGEFAIFNVYFLSGGNVQDIKVELKDYSSNKLIHTFTDPQINNGKEYTISQSIYQTSGSFYIKVIGTDTQNTDSETLYLIVNSVTPPANNAPEITSSPSTQVNEKTSYNYQITATDADGDSLTYSLMQSPSWLSINQNTGLITGTAPYVSSDISYTIKVKVSDGEDYDTQTYTLTVKDLTYPEPNNPPVIISNPITKVDEKEDYDYQVTATDADGDSLTYSLMQSPSWLSINQNTGLITGTAPYVSSDTSYTIKVKVSDGEDYDTQTYTLTVEDEEDDEDDDDDYHTHETTSSHYQTDTFYEHKYFSQFESKTIEQARTISGLSKSEQKELSWFQIFINWLKRLFGFK